MKISKSAREQFVRARAEANAFIDKRAAEIAKTVPGVPLAVVRGHIAPEGCACASAIKITEEIERENA
jgi:hypothetical protein